MNTMSERIALCVKNSGLTKTAFAQRINVSQPFITQLTNGSCAPSDRTIIDICREFGINEQWLRTGEGEMFLPKTRDEELAAFFGDVLREGDGDFRRRLLAVMARLTTDEWAMLENMAWKLVDELGDKEKPAP